jgi:hypothetical protein
MKTQLLITLVFAALSLISKFQFDLPFPVSILLLLIGLLIPSIDHDFVSTGGEKGISPFNEQVNLT